jgi:hypothetical protein
MHLAADDVPGLEGRRTNGKPHRLTDHGSTQQCWSAGVVGQHRWSAWLDVEAVRAAEQSCSDDRVLVACAHQQIADAKIKQDVR